MHDRKWIISGLVVFIVAATFPVWFGFAFGARSGIPELERPSNAESCIEDTAFMRAHHMDLLDDWRNAVVREGKKTYVSNTSGQEYDMSLTGTCMKCHTSRENFCMRCHDYSTVEPACWNCHLNSRGTE